VDFCTNQKEKIKIACIHKFLTHDFTGQAHLRFDGFYKQNEFDTPVHGRRKEGRGYQAPLDFEIWYFPINVLVEKCFLLVFSSR